ncbi:hypothetical protein [Crateriforma conspicua]|uniref:hypothetical protein n=1 Tax=Crateriforma conspicua TaxID=2527996 RepID=UPI0011885F4F|nr:hypothetical protein [Crateriforma conspicua]QDV61069.1 hypothetical protein Mal65_01920 [Crateriforma conspicua]
MANKNESKRQKKLAKQRQKAKRTLQRKKQEIELPTDRKRLAEYVLNPKKLTTPRMIDEHVKVFCEAINPNTAPTFLEIDPEEWSRQSCCDLNVKHYLEKHGGGVMVCGYKIWYRTKLYIEAERHAVLRTDDGTLRDLTFAADGETRILFLPDIPDRSHNLSDNRDKIRHAVDHRVKSLAESLDRRDAKNPIQKLSDDESWATMLTFADWKSGERQASVWLTTKSR